MREKGVHKGSLVISLALVSTVAIATIGIATVALAAASASPRSFAPANVNVSQRHGNQSEEAIAVNPLNPKNVVIVSNVDNLPAGMFEGVSFDGGTTWSTSIIGNNDNLKDACCDPSLSFDNYGNLFLTYLYNTENFIPVALSTDGGRHFNVIANITKPASSSSKTSNEKGLFRFVDQPTITSGANEAWLVFNAGGPIMAAGARVAGLGRVAVADFASTRQVVPGTNNCTYGDVAIGPAGQVMNVCTLTETGSGGGRLLVSLNPNGVGGNFSNGIFVTDSHIGGFHFIPAQVDRSIDAEPSLAWDRSGGVHNGRVYLVFTFNTTNQDNNTDIEESFSDDQGASWSPAVRVNDDATRNSQFNPAVSLDPTSGNLAVTWYDCRNDLGLGGPGDTNNGTPNDDAQFWGAFSTDGGLTFTKNIQISAGTSNSHDSGNGIDFGDYTNVAVDAGVAHAAWSDNSNSTGDNPDGTLHQLDVYTASFPLPAGP
jgi:hypothetical protein